MSIFNANATMIRWNKTSWSKKQITNIMLQIEIRFGCCVSSCIYEWVCVDVCHMSGDAIVRTKAIMAASKRAAGRAALKKSSNNSAGHFLYSNIHTRKKRERSSNSGILLLLLFVSAACGHPSFWSCWPNFENRPQQQTNGASIRLKTTFLYFVCVFLCVDNEVRHRVWPISGQNKRVELGYKL
jgi:hypothetical protein